LFEICANTGAAQMAKALAVACRVRPSCWRFSVKTPTQNLNLHTFAKTLEARSADSFGAHTWDPKGHAPWRVFLVRSLPRGKE
jgi:hypothetical protein